MKILIVGGEVVALEGEFTLDNGWYRADTANYEAAICSVEDADVPGDYKPYRYVYRNGLFIETEAYAAEKLSAILMQRASEYPPAADYLDGIVKNDQAQIQAYIDACLAVKAKYPKPE